MLSLYVDEDSHQRKVVRQLRARGLDVVTVADVNMLGCTDREQLAFAASQQRVLVTANIGDFADLHKYYLETGLSHAGIALLPQKRFTIGETIRRLLILAERSPAQMANGIEFLTSPPLASPAAP